jgi:hypothetical protein
MERHRDKLGEALRERDALKARLVVLEAEHARCREREERWLDMLEERGAICRCEGCGAWLLSDTRVDNRHVRVVKWDAKGEPIPFLCGPVVEQTRALLVGAERGRDPLTGAERIALENWRREARGITVEHYLVDGLRILLAIIAKLDPLAQQEP